MDSAFDALGKGAQPAPPPPTKGSAFDGLGDGRPQQQAQATPSPFDKLEDERFQRVKRGETERLATQYEEGLRASPNIVEKLGMSVGSHLQEKAPFVQSALGWVSRPFEAAGNVLAAGSEVIQGEGDKALDRLQGAGRQLSDFFTLNQMEFAGDEDFNNVAEIMRDAGVGELGRISLGPLGEFTGRGLLGFAGDVAIDPLRFARVASPVTGAAKVATRPVRAAGKVGSIMAERMRTGETTLLGLRKPFSGKVVPVSRALDRFAGAPLAAAYENARVGLAKLPVLRAFSRYGGRQELRDLASDVEFRASEKADLMSDVMADTFARYEKEARRRGVPIEDAMDLEVEHVRFVSEAEKVGAPRHVRRAEADRLLDEGLAAEKRLENATGPSGRLAVMDRNADGVLAESIRVQDDAAREADKLITQAAKAREAGENARSVQLEQAANRITKQAEKRSAALARKAETLRKAAEAERAKVVDPLRAEIDAKLEAAYEIAPERIRDHPKLKARIRETMKGYLDDGFSRSQAFRAARAVHTLGVDPVMAPFAAQFLEKFRDVFGDELRMGLAIEKLSDPALAYVTRAVTPEAAEHLARNPRAMRRFRAEYRVWDARHGSTRGRKATYAGKTIPEVNAMLRDAMPEFKGRLFEVDPSRIAAARSRRLGRAARSSDFFRSVLDDFGRPASDALENAGWRRVDDAIGDAGLRTSREAFPGGEKIPTALGFAEDMMVPPDIAHALRQTAEVWNAKATSGWFRENLGGVLDVYDDATGFFKLLSTAYWPAFHVRNSVSNIWANYLADVRNPARYSQAAQIMKDMRSGGERVWKFGDRTYSTKRILRMMENGRALGFGSQSVAEISRAFGEGFRITRFARRIGEGVENFAKIANFVDGLHKGMSPEAAIRRVKKYLFDYGDLTPFEKRVMKRVVPFYTWTRKNIPLQLESLVTKPSKAATLKHFQDWLQGRGDDQAPVDNILVPYWEQRRIFGAVRDGEDVTVRSGIGVGFEDLSLFDLIGQDITNIDDFLSMLNPMLKAPAEVLVAKRDIYRNVPIGKADLAPGWWRHLAVVPGGRKLLDAIDYRETTGADGQPRWRANPLFMRAVWGLPYVSGMSRASTSAEDIFNPRENRPEPWLRYMTGIRVTTIDRQAQVMNAVRNMAAVAQRRLRGLEREGVMRSSYERYSVRKDIIDDPRAKEAERMRALAAKLGEVISAMNATEAAETQAASRSGGR